MTEKLTTYDPAADLATDEAIAIFMAEAFQTNDTGYVAHALGVVARAKRDGPDCRADRAFPRTALPLFQRERQSHLEDDAGRYKGFGH